MAIAELTNDAAHELTPRFGSAHRDEITRTMENTWDELFGKDREEVEAFQLNAARRRFDELMPNVKALKAEAEANDITSITSLNDLVPLLFNHAVYKSYPMSLLEKNRFDLLTRWLDGMTSVDLSHVKVRDCESIDQWIDILERETPLQIYHTSGTSGKLSFLPRTTMERDLWNENYLKMFNAFGDEPGCQLGGAGGLRLPVIYPSARNGRYIVQRLLKYFAEEVAPAPDDCYTLTNGTLSADLVSLSGRIRIAQAKGNLAQMRLSEPMRISLKQYLAELERRPQEMADFFGRMIDQLRGQRVFMFSQLSFLVQASLKGIEQGISDVFATDSVGATGGGGKDVVIPDDWPALTRKFTGIGSFKLAYGMTEMIGVMSRCPDGYYHIPPYYIPYLLNPETGAILPREGRQTGQYAALDLLAQSYWGGITSSDKVTIEWDRACPCGRKGAHIHDDVTRYAANVTGDDKVTCSATIDNTDAALQSLLAI